MYICRAHMPRAIHTFSARSDLFSFFRKTKVPEPVAAPPPKPKKTAEVMNELASDSKKVGRPKLRVLGEPPVDNSWEQENNDFEVNAWPVKTIAPKLTAAEVDEAVKRAYNSIVKGIPSGGDIGDTSLLDLKTRFAFTKYVNQVLKVAIPDAELNTITSVGDVENYYKRKVIDKEFNEWEPEAIYLKPEDFQGYNVTIIDAKAERKKLRERRNELLKAAKRSEAQRQRELLEKAFD